MSPTMPQFYRRPGWLGQGDLIHEIQLSDSGWNSWFETMNMVKYDLATKGIYFDPFDYFPTKAERINEEVSNTKYTLKVSCRVPEAAGITTVLEMMIPDDCWIWLLRN